MIDFKTVKRIEKTISKKVINELQDLSIISMGPGSYCLYNRYNIEKKDNFYLVTMGSTFTEVKFNVLKNAVAWCSYDKRNLIIESKRIVDLDLALGSIETDIILHSQMLKRTKSTDDKLIYAAKLTEDKKKKKEVSEELRRFIEDSNSWNNRRLNKKPEH